MFAVLGADTEILWRCNSGSTSLISHWRAPLWLWDFTYRHTQSNDSHRSSLGDGSEIIAAIIASLRSCFSFEFNWPGFFSPDELQLCLINHLFFFSLAKMNWNMNFKSLPLNVKEHLTVKKQWCHEDVRRKSCHLATIPGDASRMSQKTRAVSK